MSSDRFANSIGGNQKRVSLIEVGIFYLVCLFVIWGSGVWKPPVLLVAVVLIGICIGSNRYHKDTLERIGLAKKNFLPNLKLISFICLPLLVPLIFLSWNSPVREGWNLWFAILGYPFWGFAQEYALLGFVANRLEDAMGDRWITLSLLNGLLFSMAHLPNPYLMGLTFTSGVLFTAVFLRRRHLIPLALYHAAFGVVFSLLTSQTDGLMSVGPAYISRMGGWF